MWLAALSFRILSYLVFSTLFCPTLGLAQKPLDEIRGEATKIGAFFQSEPPLFCSKGDVPRVATSMKLVDIKQSKAHKLGEIQLYKTDSITYEINYVGFGLSSTAVFEDGPKTILVEETFSEKWKVTYEYSSVLYARDRGVPSTISVYSYSQNTKRYDALLRRYEYVEADWPRNDAIYEEGNNRVHCNAGSFVIRH